MESTINDVNVYTENHSVAAAENSTVVHTGLKIGCVLVATSVCYLGTQSVIAGVILSACISITLKWPLCEMPFKRIILSDDKTFPYRMR